MVDIWSSHSGLSPVLERRSHQTERHWWSSLYVKKTRKSILDCCVQGNDVMFVHFSEPVETGPSGHKFRVLMHESAWERLDRPGSPASREYIMMALAGLDNILIKAAHSGRTSTAGISDVSLDTGSERDPRSGRGRASAVEQCQCPPGYKGLSCEDCAPGYRRSGLGLYLGHCEPCDCNGKSSSCDSETGKCLVKACIAKPKSKSPIPCPNRPQVLSLSPDQNQKTQKLSFNWG